MKTRFNHSHPLEHCTDCAGDDVILEDGTCGNCGCYLGYADGGVLLVTPDPAGAPIVEAFNDMQELEESEKRLPS